MQDDSFIAQRERFSIDKDGNAKRVKVAIGAPYPISPQEWGCAVLLVGFYGELREQRGVDSWQAMQLALRLVVQLLDDFTHSGGKLYCGRSGMPISANEFSQW